MASISSSSYCVKIFSILGLINSKGFNNVNVLKSYLPLGLFLEAIGWNYFGTSRAAVNSLGRLAPVGVYFKKSEKKGCSQITLETAFSILQKINA